MAVAASELAATLGPESLAALARVVDYIARCGGSIAPLAINAAGAKALVKAGLVDYKIRGWVSVPDMDLALAVALAGGAK